MRGAWRWLVSVAVACVFLAPLWWMLLASFRPSADVFGSSLASWFSHPHFTLENYAAAVRRAALPLALANTLLQVVLVAGLGLLVNSMAAYAFARLEFRGRELLFALVVALMILPLEALAVPMFLTARDLGLTGGRVATLAALVLPFVAKAFNVYFLRQQLLLLPAELEEAAALDGAGVWTLFWHVALPSIRPALATVVLLDALFHFSDFLWPLLVATREETRTVQVSLANLFTEPPIDWGAILAAAVLATLPVMLLFRVIERYLVATDVRVGIR